MYSQTFSKLPLYLLIVKYSKTKINASQISKLPLVLHPNQIVRMVERVELSTPDGFFKSTSFRKCPWNWHFWWWSQLWTATKKIWFHSLQIQLHMQDSENRHSNIYSEAAITVENYDKKRYIYVYIWRLWVVKPCLTNTCTIKCV